VLTRPADLAEDAIREALASAWGLQVQELAYRPVGFGSYHWLAETVADGRLFLSIDDLYKRQRHARETPEESFERLRGAFEAAAALGRAGCSFVVAPMPDRRGQILCRLGSHYTLVVHPFVVGEPAGQDGRFNRREDLEAVVDRLAELHRATAGAGSAPREDGLLPNRDRLLSGLDRLGETWDGGPFGEPARHLLAGHAPEVELLLATYDQWAEGVLGDQDGWVLTHGEPGASNVLIGPEGPLLVDWESALIAPPERDLWDLEPGDGSVLRRYRLAGGAEVSPQALRFYRLYYDLFEIGGYLGFFGQAHTDDADARESWKNLSYFLRPAERWPDLVS